MLNNNSGIPHGNMTISRLGKTAATTKSNLVLDFDLFAGSRLLTGTLADAPGTAGGASAAINGWATTFSKVATATTAVPTAYLNVTTVGAKVTTVPGIHNFRMKIPATLQGDAAHPEIPQGDSFCAATVGA